MHRQANIPHESPVDRMGKKYEGGPWPKQGNSWQPLRCLSPPWARKGGESERPDGKWRGWGRGTLLVQECMWRYVRKDRVLAFVSISRYLTASVS